MILDDFLGSGHPQNAPKYRKSYLPNSKLCSFSQLTFSWSVQSCGPSMVMMKNVGLFIMKVAHPWFRVLMGMLPVLWCNVVARTFLLCIFCANAHRFCIVMSVDIQTAYLFYLHTHIFAFAYTHRVYICKFIRRSCLTVKNKKYQNVMKRR
jgi:hypothetical protein